jgi:hypothetical protein
MRRCILSSPYHPVQPKATVAEMARPGSEWRRFSPHKVGFSDSIGSADQLNGYAQLSCLDSFERKALVGVVDVSRHTCYATGGCETSRSVKI